MHNRFLLILCLGLSGLAGFAGSNPPWSAPQFSGRVWHVEYGLPRNTVQAIAQTPDGYMWIGTQSGLARFDGEQFEWFELPTNKAGTNQWINSLTVTRDGTLWIGTGGRGLFECKNATITQRFLRQDLNLVMLSLMETAEGDLLCGTRRGLLRFKSGTFEAIGDTNAPRSSPEGRVAMTTIRSITREADGKYLVAVPGEILELSGNEISAKHDMRDVNADNFVRAIFSDNDGTIWIGSNAGLTQVKNGKFTHYSKADGLPDNTVNAIYRDRNNNLWIGTYGGICRFINGNFVITTAEDGEPFDQVLCFFEDRENNLWAGGKEGLCQLTPRQFYTLTTRHGLSHNNVISVYGDRQNTLWVGSWGGGLNFIRDGKIGGYSSENTPQLKNDLVLAIHETHDGSLWFSTDYDGSLYQLKSNVVTRVAPLQGSTNVVRTMAQDKKGKLWLGTVAGGLFSLSGQKLNRYGRKEGITNVVDRCVYLAKDDSIWVGTESGLFHQENGKFTAYGTVDGLGSAYILSVYEDNAKTLWVGTSDGGLSRFQNGRFKTYTTRDGLFDNSILEMIEDDAGTLWLTCFRGISCVKREDFDKLDRGELSKIPCRVFDKGDGMASSICISSAKPAAWKTADGKLWFATTKGLCVTDPARKVSRNDAIPPVLIRKIIAGKKDLPLAAELRIDAGRNDIAFHYAALSYRDPEKNRYKYKLEGIDLEWNDAAQRKVAYYNNLAPGNYTFRVIACNNDGVWNEKGAQMPFVLLPHFWQTWWFNSFCVIVSLSAVGLAARVFTKRRLQRRLQFLEQQHAIEKERSRIAQDMHDEVGAKLTKITFLGGVAKQRLGTRDEAEQQIEKISQTARELIGALDEIVWAVDPKNDTLENFANYLCRYASEFFDSSSVLCELQIPTELPHVSLSADLRHNLFLAVKESLNNVLKHSKASKVVVRLCSADRHIEVIIQDNGIGLPPADDTKPITKRVGNGLRNMQHRLNSVGGSCKVESPPGEGTTVSFRVEIKQDKKR
ncbi:MAG: two component regulator propeller/histidine kinase domain protein [Verrucomicrobiales bacterium]|nr:two component regulator propeller/histidine kinase domain protein [Verrucomicrobiales bacterium]